MTISLKPPVSPPRSAWTTSDPSGSWRSSRGTGYDEQPTVRQPVERDRQRLRRQLDLHLAAAVEIYRDDLAGAPVGEPEAPVVPARRLTDGQPVQQDLRVQWRSSSGCGSRPAVSRN